MPETSALRVKTRRVKDHILDRFLNLADKKASKGLTEQESVRYEQLTDIFAKSVLPRTQELTGEDGERFTVHIAKEVAVKNDINESDTSPSDNSQGQD